MHAHTRAFPHLCQRQVALVRERRVDELRRVALVLPAVLERRLCHCHGHAAVGLVAVVAQLPAPHPLGHRAAVGRQQLLAHVDVVDKVQHECLLLELQQRLAGVVGAGQALQLAGYVTRKLLHGARAAALER
eukprot:142636-Chlamydomonas_euryale.AAC.3